jgi:hypothetical protein
MQFSLQSLLKLSFVVCVFFALRAMAVTAGSFPEVITILKCTPPITAFAAALAVIWGPKKVRWWGPVLPAGLAGIAATLFIFVELDYGLREYFSWTDPFVLVVFAMETLVSFAIGLVSGLTVVWFRTWW